jgi:hypothetical protein
MSSLHARLGFHYYPDDQHFRQVDLETWLPALRDLGARWLTLKTTPARAVPESFLVGLQREGVEPIVHICTPLRRIPDGEVTPLLASYAAWGLRYVVVFDRPNVKGQWEPAEWSRTGLVERFLDVMLPILQAQNELGLRPVLPPLEPGGDYWDTAFLSAALQGIAGRAAPSILNDLVLAIYAWSYGRPPAWGAGGPAAWPESRPYLTPEGSQDQRGFRSFEWYAAAAEQAGMPGLPMLMVAGGALAGSRRLAVGADRHIEDNVSIARAFAGGDVPEYVLNCGFYPLATSAGHPDEDSAWLEAPDRPRPVAQALRRLLTADACQSPKTKARLRHYVLLDLAPADLADLRWSTIASVAGDPHPVVGLCAQEASLAEQVTVLGDQGTVTTDAMQRLEKAGCRVRRIAAHTAAHLFAAPVEARQPQV